MSDNTPLTRYLAFLLLVLVYVVTPLQFVSIWLVGCKQYRSNIQFYLFSLLFLIALFALPAFFPMRRVRTRELSSP